MTRRWLNDSRISDMRLGARPPRALPLDGSRYWQWWFDTYGDQALVIAKEFVRDCRLKDAA